MGLVYFNYSYIFFLKNHRLQSITPIIFEQDSQLIKKGAYESCKKKLKAIAWMSSPLHA